jgi:hypothetical protein
MEIVVYKNLTRGDWSIATVQGNDNRGKVIDHAPSLCLRNVRFVVKESARQRVCRVRQREVHAWVIGERCDPPDATLPQQEITYNPYRCGEFTTRNGAPIAHCEFVHFTVSDGAIAIGSIR